MVLANPQDGKSLLDRSDQTGRDVLRIRCPVTCHAKLLHSTETSTGREGAG